MDPYLEAPEFWHYVHHELIGQIARKLNRDLPEGFAAHIEEVVYIARPEQFAPDITVNTQFAVATNIPRDSSSTSSVAIATPIWIEVPSVELHLPRIDVVTTHGKRSVVTALEVLSPINKRGEGREKYQRKQRRLLQDSVNLVEIDLLRAGIHTVSVPKDKLAKETHWDYLICLHEAGKSGFDCWPFTVRDAIPPLRVPLDENNEPLVLDLGAMLTEVYETGPFRREIDYSVEPMPKLSAVDVGWADTLLRESGHR
jgi:Protein of unknown function (DUF4058)